MKKTITLGFFVLSTLIQTDLRAQLNVITTIAGNNTGGYNGDNIAATAAELDLPYGVCKDASGNIYIAEWNAHRVRKIDASTGIITTIAGIGSIGSTGYSGDGGQATSAIIWGPYDVKIDAAGDILFADANENRVREISGSTGIITTIAGNGTAGYKSGLATNAELQYPTGLVLDAAGNIYIADEDNNRIREIHISTDSITTIAGTGVAGYTGDGGLAINAKLSAPNKLAFDASGNLYFSDEANNVIRKIAISTGEISTVVGTGTAGYSGDGGSATSATLSDPAGIMFDVSGNLYIADAENNVVREVLVSTGNISTFAGNGTQGYSGDGGMALNAEFYHPVDMVLDNNNNLVIDDDLNNVIRSVGGPLAVNTINLATNEISIFPNPAKDVINITLNKNIQSGTMVAIYNLLGEQVYVESITIPTRNISVITALFNEGIYLVKLVSSDGSVALKKFEVIK